MIMRYRCNSYLRCWNMNWVYSYSWKPDSIGGVYNSGFAFSTRAVLNKRHKSLNWGNRI